MRAGGSSIAITRAGARCATRPKYERMIAFAQALPTIRRRTSADLRRPATAAREGARGRRAAAREDADPRRQRRVRASRTSSFGLTTMRDGHVRGERRHACRFAFRGKSGVEHEIDLDDRRLARDRQGVPRHSRLRAVPVLRRERRAAGDRFGRRERVPAGDHRRGLHVEGFPHVGGHGAGGAAAA